ncbi:DHS-like NAD/FAD-binding domain-containing protein [Pseudomassariella vexata]|uniref:protein acetyllysine N-acetyltransferase n=1 Tax=Pseudomassariella vexata TaxID=1141098 RepID=A0A1Y2DG72_9PEZI|nr:DHS-like NAD/FAD-binding domain-containing protein [Pseudomassariella vexata]ORY58116.1 DHS-like NAD/FAD-binding domain-containing protein [Pseudomassariella vexata]
MIQRFAYPPIERRHRPLSYDFLAYYRNRPCLKSSNDRTVVHSGPRGGFADCLPVSTRLTMATTARRTSAAERREEVSIVDRKATELADLIRESTNFIAFTGAGISTSAGIPDFRGPEGVWTLRAQGREGDLKAVNTLQAVPTSTHMALVELQNRRILKYLISQNCDGLHRKSGILPDRISELHGNSNRESCKVCDKEYIRDFRAVATYDKSIHDHRTGRKCTRCGGVLLDSIINFGESLPTQPLQDALNHAMKADLCLVLGSSLTVTPADEIPGVVGRNSGAKLVICNLQTTPLDQLADLRVFSDADDLMARVMGKLGVPIPPFILHRRLVVKVESKGDKRHQLTVSGVDVDDTPVTFLHSVKLEGNRRVARSEPFVINIRDKLAAGVVLKLELEFMGHYGEPNLEIDYGVGGEDGSQAWYRLEYNPQTGAWKTSTEKHQVPIGGGDTQWCG